jgi:hypothetical protein
MARPENDAKRMAAHAGINAAHPTALAKSGIGVPGVLNYSIGGGPMRSRAPGQGGPAGEDFSASQGRGFGETWKPGGGGYMQSDINSLPYEQRPESYKSANMSPAEYKMSPAGLEGEKSRLQEDVEKRRRGDYEASVNHAKEVAQKFIQEAQGKPEPARTTEITKVTTELEDRIKTITAAFGIGARMPSNALYNSWT